MDKFASCDFEFYDTAESSLKLICCSVRHDGKTHSFWIHDDLPYGLTFCKLRDHIEWLNKKGYIFLAYAVTAEARAFLALELKPLMFKWIDLYLEYRCLSNHNDKYAYGKQLIKGKTRFTKKPLPKWKRKTEEDEKKADSSKQEYGMAAAVYKTLGLVIDTDVKTEARDIIIACNSGEKKDIDKLVGMKKLIMDYCDSDVIHLEPMFKEMAKE